MMCRIVRLAALAVAWHIVIGCSGYERPYDVLLKVPDDFRGTIRIIFDDSGTPRAWEDGALVFRVPESGVVVSQGENPFLKFGDIEVVAEGGETIAQSFPDQLAPDESLFRVVGSTNDGRQFWAVIGTLEDEEEAALDLAKLQSDMLRRDAN